MFFISFVAHFNWKVLNSGIILQDIPQHSGLTIEISQRGNETDRRFEELGSPALCISPQPSGTICNPAHGENDCSVVPLRIKYSTAK